MVQFFYSRLYLSIKTVSCRLLQRMERMHGHRLKLHTIGPPFSYLKVMPPSPLKITSMYVLVLPDEIRFISS